MSVVPIHEQTGLTIRVADPLWRTDGRDHIDTITHAIDSYEHKHSAFIGFDEAGAQINAGLDLMEDWLEDGLGRHIEVIDSDLQVQWEGFVNQIDIVVGGLSVRRGPLLDIANRVYVVYRPVNIYTLPPTYGDRTPTIAVDDEGSQAKYGIITKTVSGGQIMQYEAEKLRDTYLEEHKEPETSQTISSDSSQSPHITLSMQGYGYWLDAFTYNQIAVSLTTTVYDKLLAVLAVEQGGNAMLSTDYSEVDENLVLAAAYENDDPYGLTVVKELTALGGGQDQRYLFMITEGRKVFFQPQPTEYEYSTTMSDNSIRGIRGELVHPWAIRAGKWIKVTDFLPGLTEPTTLREDPRSVFIESVTYNAPYSFSIEGSKTNTIAQKLAKLGMQGIAA